LKQLAKPQKRSSRYQLASSHEEQASYQKLPLPVNPFLKLFLKQLAKPQKRLSRYQLTPSHEEGRTLRHPPI
jgi:hypothetical protein